MRHFTAENVVERIERQQGIDVGDDGDDGGDDVPQTRLGQVIEGILVPSFPAFLETLIQSKVLCYRNNNI